MIYPRINRLGLGKTNLNDPCHLTSNCIQDIVVPAKRIQGETYEHYSIKHR